MLLKTTAEVVGCSSMRYVDANIALAVAHGQAAARTIPFERVAEKWKARANASPSAGCTTFFSKRTLMAVLSRRGVKPLSMTPRAKRAVPPAVSPINETDAFASGGNFTPKRTRIAPKTGAHTRGFVTVDFRLPRRDW